jgi:N-methylhydantoinase B/oxoprolinase/acetone carboxylase alpha subunit
MTAVMLANHRRIAPFGVAGGLPGAVGRNWVERAHSDCAAREDYGATFAVEMHPGDLFVVETPGGGGFGPPEEATRRQRSFGWILRLIRGPRNGRHSTTCSRRRIRRATVGTGGG